MTSLIGVGVISCLSSELNDIDHGYSALKSLIQAVYLCPAFLPWQRARAKQIWDMVARDNPAVSPLPVEISMPPTPRSPSIAISSSGTATPVSAVHPRVPSPSHAPTPVPSPDFPSSPVIPPVVLAAAEAVRRQTPSPLSLSEASRSPIPPAPSSPHLLSPPVHGSFASPHPLGPDDSAIDMVSPTSRRRRPPSIEVNRPPSTELEPYVEEEAIAQLVLASASASSDGRSSRGELRPPPSPDADDGAEPRRGRSRRSRTGRRSRRGKSPAAAEAAAPAEGEV